MNYNRFISGTFDPDPFDQNMENSLFPNGSLNHNKISFLANR